VDVYAGREGLVEAMIIHGGREGRRVSDSDAKELLVRQCTLLHCTIYFSKFVAKKKRYIFRSFEHHGSMVRAVFGHERYGSCL